MFGMPAPTPFDLNFRLMRVPVRVSPWFWLITAMLGPHKPELMILWIPCVFLSILVHEMGHALVARSFGHRAEIALYGMGGVCASEPERETFGQRLAILFGGPGAQLLLLAALAVGAVLWLGIGWRGDVVLGKLLLGIPFNEADAIGRRQIEAAGAIRGPQALNIYFDLFQINLLWPLLNLLPIFPLDGGQITRTIWVKADYRHGARRTHILSMVTAGILAAWVASRMSGGGDQNSFFMILFFGSFALMNYQLLQAYHQQYETFGAEDSEWWKR